MEKITLPSRSEHLFTYPPHYNAVGELRCVKFRGGKSVNKMYGLILLPLLGGGWVGVDFPEKKRYVTLESPLISVLTVSAVM